VPYPMTQQANLPTNLHTIPVLCWTSSREAENNVSNPKKMIFVVLMLFKNNWTAGLHPDESPIFKQPSIIRRHHTSFVQNWKKKEVYVFISVTFISIPTLVFRKKNKQKLSMLPAKLLLLILKIFRGWFRKCMHANLHVNTFTSFVA